jgi:competence protein ComEC
VISIRGALNAFATPGNPGEFDYAEFENLQGVAAECRARSRADAVRLAPAAPASVGALAAACHRHWVAAIWQYVPAPAQALVVSLVLGDRGPLSRSLQETMAATGIAHILAVSGMNIGLVMASLLGLGRLCRFPRLLAWLLGLAGVALFTAMAGDSPSVLRAALMAGVSIFTLMWERPADGLSVLSLTALVLLAWDPHSGAQPGFQLSYAATAGLITAAPWLPRFKSSWKKWFGPVVNTVGLTGAAMLGTLPLQWLYFYSVTPVGLLTNLAALPLVTVATDGGLLLGLLGGFWPPGAHAVGYVTGWAARGIVAAAQLAQSIPWGRIFVGRAEPFWAAGVYAAAALSLWRPTRWGGVLGLVLLAALVPGFRDAPPAAGETRFTFLDLGVGESTLLETGDGRRVLVDAGTEGEFLWRIKPFLASRGINRLDAIMISHPDADHAGGTLLCLIYFKPREILYSGFGDGKAKAFEDSLKGFAGWQHCLYRGEAVNLGPNLVGHVLWPPRFEGEGETATAATLPRRRGRRNKRPHIFFSRKSESNEHSLIALWEFPGGNALFTGDASAENEYWGTGFSHIRLLKVAHHGSQYASSELFLVRCAPELAVVQSGFFGQHHFPHPAAWERLQRYTETALDTSRQGAVQVTFSAKGQMRWVGWK